MARIVSLEEAIEHLRIDDYVAEEAVLDLYIQAASGVVLDYLEREEWDFADYEGIPDYPFQMKAATLLLIGDLYRFRDSSSNAPRSVASLPHSVRALLYPLKTWGLAAEDEDSGYGYS
jgi:hypothetical protein